MILISSFLGAGSKRGHRQRRAPARCRSSAPGHRPRGVRTGTPRFRRCRRAAGGPSARRAAGLRVSEGAATHPAPTASDNEFIPRASGPGVAAGWGGMDGGWMEDGWGTDGAVGSTGCRSQAKAATMYPQRRCNSRLQPGKRGRQGNLCYKTVTIHVLSQ